MGDCSKKRRIGNELAHDVDSYKYAALNPKHRALRILELLPASSEHLPLRALLHHEHLGNDHGAAPAYEAVSYTWGSTDKPNVLYIDEQTLPIGENLDSALRIFRPKSGTRRLWVDAVCINQNDDEERTNQVAIMTSIYAGATRTLAWLGPDGDSEAEEVFAFLTWLASTSEHLTSMLLVDFGRGTFPRAEYELVKGSIDTIFSFTQRPYFSRRWIVQELGVAKQSQFWCGRHCIEGGLMNKAAQGLLTYDERFRVTQPLMRLMYVGFKRPRYAQTLSAKTGDAMLEVLERFRDFECRDGRDRLAALSWVWGANNTSESLINYSRSTNQNYINFATTIANTSNDGFGYLVCSAARRHYPSSAADAALPTWVPDWRAKSFHYDSPTARYRAVKPDDPTAEVITVVYTYEAKTTFEVLPSQQLKIDSRGCYVVRTDFRYITTSILQPGDTLLEFRNHTWSGDGVGRGNVSDLEWRYSAIVLRQYPGSKGAVRLVGALKTFAWTLDEPDGPKRERATITLLID